MVGFFVMKLCLILCLYLKYLCYLVEIMQDILSDENKTILMSTHITSDLGQIADYLYFIFNGEMILYGPKDELKDQHAIVRGDVRVITQDSDSFFVCFLHQY